MPLPEHSHAPDFSLPSTEGRDFTLSKTAGQQPLILYFYPKDFTRVCTLEACEFRDHFDYFRELDIPIYGISPDSLETHNRFRAQHRLPFHLLSDPKNKVAALYKATIPIINISRRITYLLDKDHRIAKVYEQMFGAEEHIRQMAGALKEKS